MSWTKEYFDSLPHPKTMSLTDLFGEIEGAGDSIAEIEGEIAAFGDSAPGTYWMLARYRWVIGEIRRREDVERQRQRQRDEARALFRPAADGLEDVPF